MPTDYRLGRLNGRWVAVWYENGRRRRWTLAAESATDARAAFREFCQERDRLTQPARRVTVSDCFSEYLKEKIAQGKVSATRMADAWKALSPTFDKLRPQDITGSLVRGYIERRRLRVSDGTIHTELGYLRAALGHAFKHGMVEVVPPITLPSKPRPKDRHLTPEEARRLIDACAMPHVRLFVQLALYTAGRPSSILDLTWDRVHFRDGKIQLDNPQRDRTAKGRATVPIAACLVEPLRQAQLAALTDYVIEWAGKPIRSIKKGIQRAARRGGVGGVVGVTPYVLRHTAAVWMAEADVPMHRISQYLGHTSTAVTERVYARFSPSYLRAGTDAIHDRLHTGDTGRDEPVTVNARATKQGQSGKRLTRKLAKTAE
jgi:integrase